MASQLEPAALTDEQRAAFLALIRDDKTLGNIHALRQAGVPGTRGQLRALIDDDLEAQSREARGWRIRKVEDTTWKVATDTEHPSWDRANARLLKAYGGPQFRDQTEIVHAGGMEVTNPDVAAAIDRFTALADAAIRAAARVRAPEPAIDALPGGDGGTGLPVGRVASKARTAPAG